MNCPECRCKMDFTGREGDLREFVCPECLMLTRIHDGRRRVDREASR